jgi:hypothetical protein
VNGKWHSPSSRSCNAQRRAGQAPSAILPVCGWTAVWKFVAKPAPYATGALEILDQPAFNRSRLGGKVDRSKVLEQLIRVQRDAG